MNLHNLLFASALLLLVACSPKAANEAVTIHDGLTEINVLKAYEDKRDVPLSQFVKDVELVYLESTPESYFDQARSLKVGKKFIMIADYAQNKVFLFERETGKFLRTIGRKGGGPGEYNYAMLATMDPLEKYIVITDFSKRKILLFSTDGTFLRERDISKECPTWISQDQPSFLDEEHFAFSVDRPRAAMDDFHSVYVYDLELNLVNRLVPRMNDEDLLIPLTHRTLAVGAEGPFYWEMVSDTMYYFSVEGKAKPAYHFAIDKNQPTAESLNAMVSASERELKYQLGGVVDMKRYLYAWSILETSAILVYDKKEKEAYVIAEPVPCRETVNTWMTHWVRNDVYGFHSFLVNYHPEENIAVVTFNPAYIEQVEDLKCIRCLEVTHPEIRDELADLVEEGIGDGLPVVVLMYLR